MDEKISLKAIDQYSEEFASKISAAFFSNKERINGPEILSLCEIHQINLFVICELLHSWRAESDKLKSPFFDYQAPEVSEALKVFQNTLSNHISISQSHFLPLLKKSVSMALRVLLTPYDYYSDFLERLGGGFVTVANFKSDLKYLKINRAPLEKLLQKLEEKKLALIQRNEAFAMLDSILEEVNFTPEEIDGYLPRFTSVIPLDPKKFLEAVPSSAKKDEFTDSPPEVPLTPTEEVQPIAVAPVKVQPAVNKPIDRSVKPVPGNLQKIARIKDTLTINQKFMFTKILFHGDFEIFSQAVERIDRLDNFKQAENYILENWPEWDKESAEYLEFREMLERRFS